MRLLVVRNRCTGTRRETFARNTLIIIDALEPKKAHSRTIESDGYTDTKPLGNEKID
jgi:hypothetical protein